MQPVALRRTRVHDDGMHDGFIAAASRYAVLDHPSIAKVIDLGAVDGRSYVATQLIDGHDLLAVLAKCAEKKVGFPTDVALYIVKHLLAALDHAHHGDVSVVHGDLSHSNVLVTARGEVLVTDFGMRLGSTRRRSSSGLNHARRGFACYLAPEQLRDGPIDTRTDLFAVGVVLYELVTGHVLFKGLDEQDLTEEVAEGAFAVPLEQYRADIHPLLSRIIHTALASDPDHRFATASAFSRAIDELLDAVHATLEPQFLSELIRRLFARASSNRHGAS